MNESIEFKEFPKMARWSRDCVVTEKIDGTNGQIYIQENLEPFVLESGRVVPFMVGSRNRWIFPENDNAGFARWAYSNEQNILQLGPGRHFGEWWGSGIQRAYGLKNGDKRFSLFNVLRWTLNGTEPKVIPSADDRVIKMQEVLPPTIGLVPVLWSGNFDDLDVDAILHELAKGSKAVEGFNNPEGIVVFHLAANIGFKKTLVGDGSPKSRIAQI